MPVELGGTAILRVRDALQKSATLVENSGALVIGTTAMAGLGFVYWWVAARLFPPEVIGHAAALLSVMGLVGILGEAGLGTLLMGEIARHQGRGPGLVAASASVGMALAVGLALLFVFAAPLISSTGLIDGWCGAVTFVLGCCLTGFSVVADQAFVANLCSTSRMIRQVLFSVFKLMLIAAVAASGYVSNTAILLTWVAGLLASWIGVDLLTRGSAHRLVGPPDFRLLHALRRKVYDHYALDVALQASTVIMPYVVLVVLSPTINAAFVSLWMLVSIASAIPAVMATALFPVVRASPKQSAHDVRVSLTVSLLFSLVCAAFVFVYSQEVLAAFNPAYPEIAGSSLRFLGFSLVGSTLKFHACALARLGDAMRKASLWFAVGGLLELCLAVVGAKLDGLQGLVVGWTLAVSIEGACAALVLLFATKLDSAVSAVRERLARRRSRLEGTPVTVQSYRPQLDGLRAIAIGLVAVEHFGGPWVREHFPIGAGALGVHLFFVLSGFLITRNLLSRLERAPAGEVIRRFYIGRAVRLMPAYYLTLLVLFVLGVPEVHDFILWHLTYTSNYLAATGGPLLVFWSLAVEEQFYLLLPVLVILSGRKAVAVAVFLIGTGFLLRTLVLATPVDRFAFELSILGNFEILGLGVLIGGLSYAASRRGRRFRAGAGWRWTGLACLAFQAVAWYFYGNGILRHLTFNLTVGIFFAWLVVEADAERPSVLAWFSSFRFVRFVGKISYCTYLTHVFFLKIFQSSMVVDQFGIIPLWAQGLIAIALSLCVPTISWFLMESPLLKLKERVLEGRDADPRRSGSAPPRRTSSRWRRSEEIA